MYEYFGGIQRATFGIVGVEAATGGDLFPGMFHLPFIPQHHERTRRAHQLTIDLGDELSLRKHFQLIQQQILTPGRDSRIDVLLQLDQRNDICMGGIANNDFPAHT